MTTNDEREYVSQLEARIQRLIHVNARLAEERIKAQAQIKQLAEVLRIHDEALQELDRAGWPCRLAELPNEYRMLERETERLRAELTRVTHERDTALSQQSKKSVDTYADM